MRRAAAALKEAMTPRFRTDESGARVPDIRAAAAIAFNPETGEVVWQENGTAKRPIASITKVMTALVFLEDNPDLTRDITIQRSDVYAASTTYLRANERVSVSDVLHLALIPSDNAAARALARVSHGWTASFVERMNEKAIELGLVMAGKTGFISKAGYCLATLLRLPQSQQTVAVVVLGAKSNTGRFWETRHLFNWLTDQAADLFTKEQQQAP